MQIRNQQSPNFKMNVKGLENRYFETVSKKLKDELLLKASTTEGTNFTVEFIPTKDNWVFLRKTVDDKSRIVDYFPPAYNPKDIVTTFLKAYIPQHRIMAKSLQTEVKANAAQAIYRQHTGI